MGVAPYAMDPDGEIGSLVE